MHIAHSVDPTLATGLEVLPTGVSLGEGPVNAELAGWPRRVGDPQRTRSRNGVLP